MTQSLATREQSEAELASVIADVVVKGDLAKLSEAQRVAYYRRVCQSLGLNELTKPFDYIILNSKLTLYVTRAGTDQLRRVHGVSITRLERQTVGDIHFVTAYATAKDGRSDSATGAVSLRGLAGENLANAYMKCETKAKRRVTLSICGLGWLDETELESIPGAETAVVNIQTGEISGYVPIKDQAPSTDSARSRRGRMLERYGALLTEARHSGVVDDAAPWVLPPDTSDEELERRGIELADRLEKARVVRVGDALANELAGLIETAAANEVEFDDCKLGFPAPEVQVKRAIGRLQGRLDEAMADAAAGD